MEIQQFALYRVRLAPRETYKGRPQKPGMSALAGREMVLSAMWLMDENDPYPGEWALGDTGKTRELESAAGIPWVASGDVEIIDVVRQAEPLQPA